MTLDDLKEELEMSMTIRKGSFFKHPEFGHRFDELKESAATEDVRGKAQSFVKEAVQWMIDLGHASSVESYAQYDSKDRLLVGAEMFAKSGRSVTFERFVEVSHV